MYLWLLIFGGLVAAAHQPRPNSANIFDVEFDRLVEDILEASHVPGISIAVVRNETVVSKGYGYSILPDTPATPDTLYFTGSTTKAFTAAVAAKVVLDNSSWSGVTWKTPLAHLLPGDFVLHDEYATSHVTLEDALSHRSGLPGHEVSLGWIRNATALDHVRLMRHLPNTAEMRTRFQYNNVMYTAVGAALERLTGRSLEDLLQEWFWRPLGMQSTTMSAEKAEEQVDDQGKPRLAQGYWWTGNHYVPDPHVDHNSVAAAGAIISSVNDYALWMQAILGTFNAANSSSPVDPLLLQHVTTPRSIYSDQRLRPNGIKTYALGWGVVHVGSQAMITHTGGTPGFITEVYVLPYLGLGFVSVENGAASESVGSQVFLAILQRLGVKSSDSNMGTPSVENFEISARRGTDPITSSSTTLMLNEHKEASFGALADYSGIYFHPGYGQVNVSIATSTSDLTGQVGKVANLNQSPLIDSENLAEATPALHITFTSRTWPVVVRVEHDSGSVFDISWYNQHGTTDHTTKGCGAVTSRPQSQRQLGCFYEIALELSMKSKAVFERGTDGAVDRLGLQVEPAMLGSFAADDWRSSMIWFKKGTSVRDKEF